jgi:hypothetical protein
MTISSSEQLPARFADPVDRALDLPRPRLDRRQRVRYC